MNVNRNGVVRGIAAVAAATTGAVSAQAADIAAEAYVPPIVDDESDWTGFYAGGSVGYSFGDVDWWDDNYDIDGGIAGGFMGFNHDTGNWVFGAEAAFHAGAVNNDTNSTSYEDYRVHAITDVKARAGYDFGDWLLYGFTGGSASSFKKGDDGDSYTQFAINLGAGVEAMVTNDISVGLEYIHRFPVGGYDQTAYNGTEVNVQSVTLRAAWHF